MQDGKKPKRVVITGGPGTGKTALVAALERKGLFCYPEIIREMTLAAKTQTSDGQALTNPLEFVADPITFNTLLLEARKEQYLAAEKVAAGLVVYDRGMPDTLGYMRYFGQTYGDTFREACEHCRYDLVFSLPPWEAIYVQDEARMETYAQAVAIHGALESTYRSLGYNLISIPKDTVEARVDFLLNSLPVDHG